MAKIRIWHASRDPYHCAFRLIRLLLGYKEGSLAFDRLRLIDMFFLYPVLLHGVSMPRPVKNKFQTLNIRGSQRFSSGSRASCPGAGSAPLSGGRCFSACRSWILMPERLGSGTAVLNVDAVPSDIRARADAKEKEEPGLCEFLTGDLSSIPLTGRDGLYRRAGVTKWDRLS